MDCQKLMVYGIVVLVGLYLLRETCGLKLPFIDSFEGYADSNINNEINMASNVVASEGLGRNERPLPVSGMNRTPTSCYPQNTLTPDDLLPKSKSQQIKDFNNANPTGEGILKGVNYLDAGFHIGVNTVGQSLRNANLQLRSEPANPQVNVSPWMNSTINPDLERKPLEDENVCHGKNNNISNVNGNINASLYQTV
jgi:hypothetical protein